MLSLARWCRTRSNEATPLSSQGPEALMARTPVIERIEGSKDRVTGARGLRSIMEGILLDTMFDLPSLEGVEEVVISKQVVEATGRPLYIHADRPDRAGDANAS